MTRHLASYAFDGYRLRKTEGSSFRTVNAIRRLRSVRGGLALGRRTAAPLQDLVKDLRNDGNPEPHTELPKQIMSFLRGSQTGDIDISFDLMITGETIRGEVSGTFKSEGLTIDLQTQLPDEDAVREFLRDMLCILFQYNVGIEMLSVDIHRHDNAVQAEGSGLLTIPESLEEDRATLRAVTRTRLFRDLILSDNQEP